MRRTTEVEDSRMRNEICIVAIAVYYMLPAILSIRCLSDALAIVCSDQQILLAIIRSSSVLRILPRLATSSPRQKAQRGRTET